MTPPTLHTDRLTLRPNRPEDFEAYAAFYASGRSRLRGGPLDRSDAWMVFAAEIGHWALRGYGFWAIEETATGSYCGQVGLWNPEGWPAPEVGWLMVDGHEGKGIAFEAAIEARRYAYDVLGWPKIASCIADGNTRSIRLAERMGAWLEQRTPREGRPDMLVYRHPKPEAVV